MLNYFNSFIVWHYYHYLNDKLSFHNMYGYQIFIEKRIISMKLIDNEMLSAISGAGGRNDPPFHGSGPSYNGSSNGGGYYASLGPDVNNCNNSIIGGASGGAVTGAFSGGPAGALAGAAGGAITGAITGCFNGGSQQGNGAGKGSGTNCCGGFGGGCSW